MDWFIGLKQNYFEEQRNPGVGYFFYSSMNKKGKQSLQNRLLFMRSIENPWNNLEKQINDDTIRIELKKTFLPYYKEPCYKAETLN